jgi:hypothetical protein
MTWTSQATATFKSALNYLFFIHLKQGQEQVCTGAFLTQRPAMTKA